jgi:membrane protein
MARFYKSYDKTLKSNGIQDSNSIHETNDNPNQKPKIVENPLAKKIRIYLQGKTTKGLKGNNFYDVGRYFLRSLFKENLSVRASALSFNFFLALFPALMFLLTLIAYLPIKGMKTQFINQLALILPQRTYEEIAETIIEILNKQNSSLLSFGFLLTIYFASNAFHLLINSFNRSLAQGHSIKHNYITIRAKAVFLTFFISILIISFLLLITWAYQIEHYMEIHQWKLLTIYSFLIETVKYFMIGGIFLLAISSIYYFAPSSKKRWRFFSAGSVVATILALITTFGFSIYVNNFDSYNKIYGSIGAILALMALIYMNSLSVIIGFELNTSIDKAELSKNKIA